MKKGSKHTEETKRKMRASHKGNKGMLGKKHSKESKKKMSEAHKGNKSMLGKHHSEETKRKISEAHRGKKLSEEHKKKINEWKKQGISAEIRRKMSEAVRGKNHWNYGKHRSIETRRKISKAKEGNVGEKAPNWKGGITPINAKIRGSIEYRLWREAVFARDNWTCQKTGEKGTYLQVHHIKPFAKFPELRTAIENGITLSRKAHKEFHGKYGRRNNTREQLEEFLSK